MTLFKDPQTQALVKLRWTTWVDLLFIVWIGLLITGLVLQDVRFTCGAIFGFCLSMTALVLRVLHSVIFLVTELKLLPEKAARLTLQSQNMPAPKESDVPLRLQLPHLWSVGWMRPIDLFWFVLAGTAWGFQVDSFIDARASLFWFWVALVPHAIYFLSMTFRISHFVLLGRAELQMLPTEAMRLIVLFQKKGSQDK